MHFRNVILAKKCALQLDLLTYLLTYILTDGLVESKSASLLQIGRFLFTPSTLQFPSFTWKARLNALIMQRLEGKEGRKLGQEGGIGMKEGRKEWKAAEFCTFASQELFSV